MTSPVLRVECLARHFDGMYVLQDVSFEIAEGTCVGLVGENGSGKTSLLNILGGIDRPDRGHIEFRLNGGGTEDITRWPAWRRAQAGIHQYFQSPRTWRNLTVREHVEVAVSEGQKDGSLLSNVRWLLSPSLRSKSQERCDELLDFVGLRDRQKDYADELSYGQAKLLGLAQLLACPRRRLFLLDEPSAGLSPVMSAKMLDLLKRIKAEGLSMLVIEHDRNLLGGIADSVLRLEAGRISRSETNHG